MKRSPLPPDSSVPQPQQTRRGRTLFLFLAKFVFSGVVIGWALHRVDLGSVYASLVRVHGPLLILSLGCLVGSTFLFAWRWRVLSDNAVPYAYSLRYTWVGFLYGAVLPGGISGDVAKGASLALSHRSMRTAALPASILLDRIIGLFILLVFFALSCLLLLISPETDRAPALQHFARVGLVVSVFGIVAMSAFRHRAIQQRAIGFLRRLVPHGKLAKSLDSFWNALAGIGSHHHLLSRALSISLLIQILVVLQNWLLLQSIDAHLTIGQVVVVYTCIGVATLLPISISGIGIREWVTINLFATFGGDPSQAVAYAWLILGGTLLLALGGALIQAGAFRPRTPDHSGP